MVDYSLPEPYFIAKHPMFLPSEMLLEEVKLMICDSKILLPSWLETSSRFDSIYAHEQELSTKILGKDSIWNVSGTGTVKFIIHDEESHFPVGWRPHLGLLRYMPMTKSSSNEDFWGKTECLGCHHVQCVTNVHTTDRGIGQNSRPGGLQMLVYWLLVIIIVYPILT